VSGEPQNGRCELALSSVRLLGKAQAANVPLADHLSITSGFALRAANRNNVIYHRNGHRSLGSVSTRLSTPCVESCIAAPSLIEKTVNPHVIRHPTVRHPLRAAADINTITPSLARQVAAHTTNVYSETDLETKARALATCTPDAELGSRN